MAGIIKGYPTKQGGTGQGETVTITSLPGNKIGLDVSIAGSTGTLTGDFTPQGLNDAIKVTTMDVDDTAGQPLPAVALSGRNSMVVQNKDGVEVLYVGPSNVTADNVIGTTSGHEVNPGETFAIDITDDIILYGRAPAGKTIRIKVTEVA